MKSSRPLTRAAFGVAALITIALLANWLVSLTPLGNRGADFTENKVHTLSDGTRSILSELAAPVTIRYYASRNTRYMPEALKLHVRRVDDLLKEYASLSGGKLRIEHLDPEPDTDAEDSANLDGINGQRMEDQNLFFGLAISCLDQKTVIPFLNPNEETLLEYQLSKAIAEVATPTKPKIAIMSALDLKGTPAMMPGQAPAPSWIIYQQLKQSFDLIDVSLQSPKLDDPSIKALLLFHPAGITPAAEFAVDQYLLHGGTVIACLDPYSVAARMTASAGNPMLGQQPNPTTSTLPTLLSAWGITFESGLALADPALATKLGGDRLGLSILTLDKETMSQKDDIITRNLPSATFFVPGAISKKTIPGITATSLIRSTTQAGFVDALKASQIDPTLERTFKSGGTSYDLLTHLTGTFKSAFPQGNPTPPTPTKDEKSPPTTTAAALTESKTPGNVFIIADTDAFYDRFAYDVQDIGGTQLASPSNGNSALLLNLIDQTAGSKHLIGSRSRTAAARPFTVVKKMEADFNQTVGKKIDEFQAKQKIAQEKLNDLQAQKSRGSELLLSPAQEAEIKKLRQEQVTYAKLVRDQEKDLKTQKDQLSSDITLLNLAATPSAVILLGLLTFLKRRSSTRAR